MDNRLILGGRVSKCEQTRYSPAGLPITRFVLEHHSTQMEAGLSREARCRIAVVVSGEPLTDKVAQLSVGSQLRVTGFISRMSHRQSESRLLLHAEDIEFLEF